MRRFPNSHEINVTYKIFHIPRKNLKKINKETQAAIHMKGRAVEVVKCKNSAVTVIYV